MADRALRPPFPWFGGKSRAAPLIWSRLGDVANYVEPFAGSLAVLLGRPHAPRVETVNDIDAYLANFWRALQADPDAVAAHADQPVNEADLHARHRWLVDQVEFRERMHADPHCHDAKIAGWWAWGLCAWIGSGWCAGASASRQIPHLGDAGMGLHAKIPHLGTAGQGLHAWLAALSQRLRYVRVACGDWARVLTPCVTERLGTTGIVLDPPYDDDEHAITYGGGGGVAESVRKWCRANGENRRLRIALCGYDGTWEPPSGWSVEAWKAPGGYGSQGDGRGRANARRERVWFSPGCLQGRGLFDRI